MDSRIQAFETIYRERLLVRLSGVGPDQDPDEYRETLAAFQFPPPPLIRQTNLHDMLPADKREQWWTGGADVKEAIMAEYEQAEYERQQHELPEDAEQNADLGPLYYEDFDDVAAIFLE